MQGVIEAQGSFEDLQKSATTYAELLTREEEQQPDEEKQKIVDAAKISRQMSTRVRLVYGNIKYMIYNMFFAE